MRIFAHFPGYMPALAYSFFAPLFARFSFLFVFSRILSTARGRPQARKRGMFEMLVALVALVAFPRSYKPK